MYLCVHSSNQQISIIIHIQNFCLHGMFSWSVDSATRQTWVSMSKQYTALTCISKAFQWSVRSQHTGGMACSWTKLVTLQKCLNKSRVVAETGLWLTHARPIKMLMVWNRAFLQVVMHSLKFSGFSFSLPTDTTFTLTNVMSTLETVQKWNDLGKQLGIPLRKRMIGKEPAFNFFITSMPSASWQLIAGVLYYREEQTALTKVSSYFQRQPGMCGRDFRSTLRN